MSAAGMDADARRKLADRLEAQGWDQGCLLPFTRHLLLTKGDEPVSELAAEGLAKEGNLGQPGPQMLLVRPAQQVAAILVTQICDLLADPADEPYAEAMPVVRLPTGEALPQPNSTRAFLLDADKRWVVDARHRLQIEKSLIPDQPAKQPLATPERRRMFAAWVGRRATRAPFPNDFEATVSNVLKSQLDRKRFANNPIAKHLHLLRVGLDPADQTRVYLALPFDETQTTQDPVQAYASELLEKTRERLPAQTERARALVEKLGTGEHVRDFQIMAISALPLSRVTMRMMLEMPPLNLEHLTYGPGRQRLTQPSGFNVDDAERELASGPAFQAA